LRPTDIRGWFFQKLYGTPNPTPQDNPTDGRLTSLLYYKKVISYFIPNKHIGWDVELNRGNRTRSPIVTSVIKAVKKKEVRRQGKASSARRPMEMEEL
jgi:hypothetical protein